MSELSDKAKAAAKLEAAKRKAEKLKALQEEAAREIAEAEELEKREKARLAAEKEKHAKEALHRAAEKQKKLARRRAVEAAKRAKAESRAVAGEVPSVATVEGDNDFEDFDEDEFEYGEYLDEPLDEVHAETGKRRKRIGLMCFNCNRTEGHYLLYYRRLWYSYVVGMTFGLVIIFGPYRCQCCGASRLMLANLLHPKYYLALFKIRSKPRRKSRSSGRSSNRSS